jgi:hypothetical protein
MGGAHGFRGQFKGDGRRSRGGSREGRLREFRAEILAWLFCGEDDPAKRAWLVSGEPRAGWQVGSGVQWGRERRTRGRSAGEGALGCCFVRKRAGPRALVPGGVRGRLAVAGLRRERGRAELGWKVWAGLRGNWATVLGFAGRGGKRSWAGSPGLRPDRIFLSFLFFSYSNN